MKKIILQILAVLILTTNVFATSNINATKPAAGTLLNSVDLRSNFSAAKTEIEELQNRFSNVYTPEMMGTVDGTADNVQIQAAHDALPQSGGTIILNCTAYSLDIGLEFSKPVIMRSNCTYGYSANNVGLFASASFPAGDDMIHTADLIAPYIFEDFRIDMNNYGRYGMNFGNHGDIFVNRVGFNEIGSAADGATAAGIFLGGVDAPFVELSNNWFNNFSNGASGIVGDLCGDNTLVEHNTMSLGSAGSGYFMDFDCTSGAANLVVAFNNTADGQKGYRFQTGANTQFIHNEVEQSVTLTNDNPYTATLAFIGPAQGLTIEGNSLNVHNKADNAIYIADVSGVHIKGNVISDPSVNWLATTATTGTVYIYPNEFNTSISGVAGTSFNAATDFRLIGGKQNATASNATYFPMALDNYSTAESASIRAAHKITGAMIYDTDYDSPAFWNGTAWIPTNTPVLVAPTDGTNDEVQIQAAIDAAGQSVTLEGSAHRINGHIKCESKTYNIADSIVFGSSTESLRNMHFDCGSAKFNYTGAGKAFILGDATGNRHTEDNNIEFGEIYSGTAKTLFWQDGYQTESNHIKGTLNGGIGSVAVGTVLQGLVVYAFNNNSCTALDTPNDCCTGANTGTCDAVGSGSYFNQYDLVIANTKHGTVLGYDFDTAEGMDAMRLPNANRFNIINRIYGLAGGTAYGLYDKTGGTNYKGDFNTATGTTTYDLYLAEAGDGYYEVRGESSATEDLYIADGSIRNIIIDHQMLSATYTDANTGSNIGQNIIMFTSALQGSHFKIKEIDIYDDGELILGKDADFKIRYDETTDNRLEIEANTNADVSIDIANIDAGNVVNITQDGSYTATGGFVGDLTGNADTCSVASAVTVADSGGDASLFCLFSTAATGSNAVVTDTNCTYNATSDTLSLSTVGAGAVSLADAADFTFGTTTGSKLGTATNQKIGFYNVTPIIQPTGLSAQLTTLTYTAPTPDYAIQNLTNIAPYGFVTADEGNTVLSVIKNLQDRVQELENKLEALGLVTVN